MCDHCTCSEQNSDQKDASISLPKEVKIVKATQISESQKRFTLRPSEGNHLHVHAGEMMKISLFGYGEILTSITETSHHGHDFDVIINTVGDVSKATTGLKEGDSVFIRGPF